MVEIEGIIRQIGKDMAKNLIPVGAPIVGFNY